ncbi:hypothetical protein BB560_000115 [Smittium megazygosporum]|uniref:Methyltransferase domain-containing protein n=1 Tax=Smittium megazygosporum TaxID=133381 RepID=A0A2T9ZLF4_9FUNG|nr:hypothetical protein BB560_000115 [Smittium megazygosporum]
MFELPPPNTEPLTVVFDKQDQTEIDKIKSLIESKHYSVKSVVFWDELDIDSEKKYKETNMLYSGDLYHEIFYPSPALASNIDDIEAKLANASGNQKRLKVLDLGCGCGRDLVFLTKRESGVQWEAFGIDYQYFNRPLLGHIDSLLDAGGFIIFSSFVYGEGVPAFEKPKPQHCIKVGELTQFFSLLGYQIVLDKIEFIEDGRPVNTFIAQKPYSLE